MTAEASAVPPGVDTIAGIAARERFEPSSVEECVEVVRTTRAARLALAPVGGATALGLGAPPARLDAVLLLRQLGRVVDHAPSDQVVVVEAGCTLAGLQRVLRRSSQRLAYDPPMAERATVGGLIATNEFGPLRARYGSLRDLLIGVNVVRADGTLARGGGRVVKNVAGFDLPKLMVGSLGTLGIVAVATFRVHPMPEAATTVRLPGLGADAVRAAVAALRERRMEPAAVVASGAGASFDLLLRFEGFAAGVAAQRDRASSLASAIGRPIEELSAEDAARAWEAHAAARVHGDVRIKVSTVPSAVEAVAAHVVATLVRPLRDARVEAYPTLGAWFLSGFLADVAGLAGALDGARASVAAAGGSVIVLDLPARARAAGIDVWGPPPAGLPIMRRVKARFDPEGRLNPGRFVGGL